MEKHFKIREDLSMKYKGYTLYRIEATKYLPEHDVKKGDIGGWIENEDRLSENAWIADEAKVFADAIVWGNAEICGEAEVRDYAKVFGNTLIFGNAKVHGNAKIRGYAAVGGNARIFGNAVVQGYAEIRDNAEVADNAIVSNSAKVSGDALIHGYARVMGNAVVGGDANIWCSAEVCGNAEVIGDVLEQENDCKNIIGVRYNITITPKYIQIGCQHHTKEEWWNFTDREILEMDGKEGLKWWKKWKPILQLICEEE